MNIRIREQAGTDSVRKFDYQMAVALDYLLSEIDSDTIILIETLEDFAVFRNHGTEFEEIEIYQVKTKNSGLYEKRTLLSDNVLGKIILTDFYFNSKSKTLNIVCNTPLKGASTETLDNFVFENSLTPKELTELKLNVKTYLSKESDFTGSLESYWGKLIYIKSSLPFSGKEQDYYSLVKTQSDIKHKIKLLNATLKDNLVYTAKLLDGEDIICPVCNSNITDFISSALKVGIAESDINTELASLKADLLNTDRKIALAKPKLDELHQEIMLIEQQRENVKITRAIIVWNEELLVAKKNFAEIQLQIDSLEASIKGYSEEMRNYNEKKQSADKSYRSAFVTLLNATNISTDGLDISSLNLYDSLHLSGSEIPRVAISRFFSLLESKTADSIVMPIIFDFPNLDMTEENLTKCFQVMCEKISDTKTYPQSFIFSINCEERISKAGASLEKINIIDIESLPMDDSANPKLLCKHDYSAYSKEISEMINS